MPPFPWLQLLPLLNCEGNRKQHVVSVDTFLFSPYRRQDTVSKCAKHILSIEL